MERIEFLFDYASPWAFLANSLVARKFPAAEVLWRPVYLRALESFRSGFPFGPQKAQYLARDLARCAAQEGVAGSPPASFPVHGLYALRGAIIAQQLGKFARYHEAIFQAAWRDSREISSRASVAGIAHELGMPEVADGLEDPAVKAALRAQTEQAASRGVFGVPTFFVGDEMFWGYDRMDHIRRAALGAHGG